MGFIQTGAKPPEILRTTRTLTVRAFFYDGACYFRTREISDLVGIKQPFAMTDWIRKNYGKDAIVSGAFTEPFRSPEQDTAETTFIMDEHVLRYLTKLGTSKHRPEGETLEALAREIGSYYDYARNIR